MTLRRRLARSRKDWALGSICITIAVTSSIIFLQSPGTTQFVRRISLNSKADFIKAAGIIESDQNAEVGMSSESGVIRDVTSVNTTRFRQISDVKSLNFIIPEFKTGRYTSCDNKTEILVYFQTMWSNFIKRRTLRNTWVSNIAYKQLGKHVKFVFIIGKPKEVNDQVKINNELLLHGDIIEGDFIDSYQNLTLKSVTAMAFIEQKCKHVKYVIKVDDDIFLNLFSVIQKVLPKVNPNKDVIICHVIESGRSPIVRDKASKWFIPREIFKNRTHLPRFCSGYMVIMTSKLVLDLFNKAKFTPLINVDDVYMFGQLTLDNKEIKFIDIKGNLTLWQDNGLDSYRKGKSNLIAVNVRDSSAMEELWSLTLIDYGH